MIVWCFFRLCLTVPVGVITVPEGLPRLVQGFVPSPARLKTV